MIDREKVKKGIRDLRRYIEDREWSDNREDRQAETDYWQAVTDAISLLKEQEAKPMIENERGWNCPSCGMELIGKTASGYPCDLIDLPLNFCPRCGQEVEHE